MSEKGGDNSGAQTHTESENVLDDLMQNNVQFDEDEKPKTVSFCQDWIEIMCLNSWKSVIMYFKCDKDVQRRY